MRAISVSLNFWLLSTLYVSRHLCAYLCIGSLLIGNAAGWLHLGCVESASPCCVEPDVDVAIAESGHRGCCHHSGDAPENQQQHSGPLDQDDNSEGSSEDAVPGKHDCPEHEEH